LTTLAVQSIGAISAGGPSAAQTMGAIHARIQLFGDTKLVGPAGDRITGALTPVEPKLGGVERIAALGTLALAECATAFPESSIPLPLIVCAATAADLGDPEGKLFDAILANAAFPIDRVRSRIIARGKEALPEALTVAEQLLRSRQAPGCFLLGTDSLVTPQRLRRLAADDLLVDGVNTDGFVPGEGAAALLLAPHLDRATKATIAGLASARDAGLAKGDPATGQAIGQAMEQAIADARLKPAQISVATNDLSGRYALFEELALAMARPPLAAMPGLKVIQPALATGEIGAASGVLALAALTFFLEREVAKDAAAALFMSEGPGRTAAVLVREKG
jgi:3-oxoacyl-[acyl-carrier-protein] synthase-1